MPPSRLSQRAQLAAARFVGQLPDRVKIRLSGEAPVIIDGQQLDPQLQFLRSVSRRRHVRGLIEPSIAAGRERFRRETRAFRGPMTAVAAVSDFDIPGPATSLRIRHYAPQSAPGDAPAPLTVYLHGGGFVGGRRSARRDRRRQRRRKAAIHAVTFQDLLQSEFDRRRTTNTRYSLRSNLVQLFVEVDDIDASLAKALALGGTVIVPL